MLLGVPRVLDGDLLKALSDMGHGDEVVVADANFPAERCGTRVIRSTACSGAEMVEAVLRLMPLDHLGGPPACLMVVADGDDCCKPSIWAEYSRLLIDAGHTEEPFCMLERDAFYDRAEKAFAVIQTGETELYGNLILRKGVVR